MSITPPPRPVNDPNKPATNAPAKSNIVKSNIVIIPTFHFDIKVKRPDINKALLTIYTP